MTKQQDKPSLWDDLVEGAREVVETLGRLLNPDQKPKRVPVPIPVRSTPPYPQRRPRQ